MQQSDVVRATRIANRAFLWASALSVLSVGGAAWAVSRALDVRTINEFHGRMEELVPIALNPLTSRLERWAAGLRGWLPRKPPSDPPPAPS